MVGHAQSQHLTSEVGAAAWLKVGPRHRGLTVPVMVVERRQRKTFASELFKPAQPMLKHAEWCTRWDYLDRGTQHPTPLERAPYRPGKRNVGPQHRSARLSVSSTVDSAPFRTIDFPSAARAMTSTPVRSTQSQMAHTGYVFGEISTLKSQLRPLPKSIGLVESISSDPCTPPRSRSTALPAFSKQQLGSRFPIGGGFSIGASQQFNLMAQGRASVPSVGKGQLTLTSHR